MTITNDRDLSELGCVELVAGDVDIQHVSASSLGALSTLVHVEGDLIIHDAPNLNSLKGLESLEHVSGSLTIHDNPKLDSLAGLEGLREVEGNLSIRVNPKLTSLSGLDTLGTVGGELELTDNRALTALVKPKNLTFLGGRLTLRSNDALENIDLDGLTEVASFVVEGNNALRTLSVPDIRSDHPLFCRDAGAHVDISSNQQLTAIDFSSVRESGCVRIGENPALESVSVKVSTFTELQVVSSPRLSKLDLGVARIRDLWMYGTALTSLRGIANATVECVLNVQHNSELTTLDLGSGHSVYANRSLAVVGNRKLPQCEAEALEKSLIPAMPLRCAIPEIDDFPEQRTVDIEANDLHATCGDH